VNLENPHPERSDLEFINSMMLIEDFNPGQDCKLILYLYLIVRYFAYTDSVFYMANDREIKLFPLVDDVEQGEFIHVKRDSLDVATIT
jgi:hypothetical protein